MKSSHVWRYPFKRLVLTSIIIFICSRSFSVDREALIKNEEGIQALNNKDYRSAIDLFQRAQRSEPDNRIINNNLLSAYNSYAMLLLREGQTLNAIDNFERALRIDENNIYILIHLGQAYYKQNDLEKAIYYLDRAYRIDPKFKGLKEFLFKIKNEVPVESGLDKLETMHFTIVSEGGLKIDNLANVRIALENAYSRIGAFFDHFPLKKTSVIIYPEAAYKKLMKGKPYWAHAIFDGKIRIPLADKLYSKDFLRTIIFHEYAHAVIRDLTRGKCPMWLNEGLACYFEGMILPKQLSFFSSFINNKTFVDFDRLPSDYGSMKSSYDANLYYREFFLLADFLADKYGSYTIRKMLAGYASGKRSGQIFKNVLSLSEDEFSEKWRDYVFSKLKLSK